MKKFGLVLAVAFICMLALTLKAEALPMPGFDGFTTFHQVDWFQAQVHWEVYAPMDATSPLGQKSDYTYIYQVYNIDGDVHDLALTQFGVLNEWNAPITDGGHTNAFNLDGLLGTVDPTTQHIGVPGSSAYWTFDEPNWITVTHSSYVLWFTSPYVPGFVNGAIQAGSINQNQPVPGPVVPEPISALLLGLGVLGLVARKRRAA